MRNMYSLFSKYLVMGHIKYNIKEYNFVHPAIT